MVFGATIFNPSQSRSQRSLSAMDFLKSVGGSDGTKKKSDMFEVLAPDIDNIREHDRIDEAYVDSLTRMNEIGLALSGKGYNVLSPDSSDPAVKAAAGYFQMLNNSANKNLIALKTHKDTYELEQKLRLQEGVVDMNPENQADPNSLVNMKTLESVHGPGIKVANTAMAKEFANDEQASVANRELDELRTNLPKAVESFAKQMGIQDPDMIESLKATFVDRVGIATADPYADLKGKKLQSEIDENNRSQRPKATSQEDIEKGGMTRKEMVFRIQHGNQLDALIGGKFGKGIVKDAEFNRTPDGSKIVLKVDNGGGYKTTEELDASDFNAINNVVESIQGKSQSERYSTDKLSTIPELDKHKQASILEEIGWKTDQTNNALNALAVDIDKKTSKENASQITIIDGKPVKYKGRSMFGIGSSLIYEDENGNEIRIKKDYETIKKHLENSMNAGSTSPYLVTDDFFNE